MQKIYVTLREFIDGKKSNHCFVQVSDGGVSWNSDLKGETFEYKRIIYFSFYKLVKFQRESMQE